MGFFHRDHLSLGSRHKMGHAGLSPGAALLALCGCHWPQWPACGKALAWNLCARPAWAGRGAVCAPPSFLDLPLLRRGAFQRSTSVRRGFSLRSGGMCSRPPLSSLHRPKSCSGTAGLWKPSSASWCGAQCPTTSVVSRLLHYIHHVILMLVQAHEMGTVTVPI